MKLSERDRQHVWHPYSQEKNSPLNIPIVKGKGAHLFSEKGEKYLDAISSWWVNTHGHAHPHIAKKISEQLKELEHTIFAGFTHPKAVELAERLLKLLPSGQEKIFYSDNGSTAVEVALKMAFQYWHNLNITNSGLRKDVNTKLKVLSFEGAYHGDTFGAMSVSGRGIFTGPFSPFLFEAIHIPFPGKKNEKKSLGFFKSQISNHPAGQSPISSFIFEPLVQGASGMRMYSAEILDEMLYLCKKNGIVTIADEVMTGFGRTGKMFASEYLSEKPDIICLSKGISGGFMPFGVTGCTKKIYNAFFSDLKIKTFFHGHSYTGNPLACAAACASLDLFGKKETWKNIRTIEKTHRAFMAEIKSHPAVDDIRTLGTILAIELKTQDETSYLNGIRDTIYEFFISEKIILRPLGNIIYIIPPYCISAADLEKIYSAITRFLNKYPNKK